MDNTKFDSEQKHNSVAVAGAISDFVGGMYDEVKHHPLNLAIDAGMGGVITLGTRALGGEVGMMTGAAFLLYEAGKGVYNLANEVSVINNTEQKFSPDQLHAAHQSIRQMGASTIDTIATMGGGFAAFETARVGAALLSRRGSAVPFSSGVHLAPAFFAGGSLYAGTAIYDYLKR
jgi:hypothetical protein